MQKQNLYLIGSLVAIVVLLGIYTQTVEAPIGSQSVVLPECTKDDGRAWDFSEGKIQLRDLTVSVAVADTSAERERGLGDCHTLPPGVGMYFAFPKASVVTFWMKDTYVPLDIVWIADGVVVGIEHNVQPQLDVLDSQLTRYTSEVPVDAVLEVVAGEMQQAGVVVGDTVVGF